jgi:hypothetical protein
MKAGLKAHLGSLGVTEAKPITGKDLHDPETYRRFVEERKANHEPIPIGRELKMAGHHWLKNNPRLSGSADEGHFMIAQWSPTQLCWYHSNEIATYARPLGKMAHWEYVQAIPVPENFVPSC